MRLQFPFIQLPLRFDAQALAAELATLDEAEWRPHPQGFPGNSALPLIAVDGDPDNDGLVGPMRPTPLLARFPYLNQVLGSLGGVLGRTRLMRLSGQSEVTPHIDQAYYWAERMRVHVPIVTQPAVRFFCGSADIHMAAGECWIFDTWRLHRVLNDADQPRIHLVADTVGGSGYWQWLRQARPHDRSPPGWLPQRISPSAGPVPELDYESKNLPEVMTPWGARDHLSFLVSEGIPSRELNAFVQLMNNFLRLWQALWAKYGESSTGLVEYRQRRDEFDKDIAAFEPLMLRNGIPLVNAVRNIVLKCLVAEKLVGPDIEQRDRPRA